MLVNESIPRDILRLTIWYPFRGIIRLLPVSWDFTLLRYLGRLHYIIFPGKNEILAENLKLAFGETFNEDELKNIILKYYGNHYVNQLQIFLFPRLNKKNIDRYHTFDGLDNLDRALAGKRGCILMHAHLGPTQLPLCILGIKGYRMVQIGFPSDEGLNWIGKNVAFRLRLKYEAKIKASIVSVKSFLRPVFGHLKNNGVVMITGDGAGGVGPIGKYERFDFFNQQIPFTMGAFRLAQKTGAPILPLFTVYEENDGRYKTIIERPLDTDRRFGEDAVSGRMNIFVERLKDYVAAAPYLWHFWDEFALRSSERYTDFTERGQGRKSAGPD